MNQIKKQLKKLRKIEPTNQWQASQWESLRATISQNHEVKQLTALQKFNTVMSNPGIFRPVGNLVVIVLVAVVGSWGMIASAENTAHGDFLYPVKKVMERVSLALIVDDSARIEKQTDLVSKRLFELNNLAIRLEYSNIPDQSLDKTVDDLKKEIEAVHASLRQVKESGNADEILAVTTHVEEKTNQLTEKITKTAEQLPSDVSVSMDDLLQEAESLAEDANKQLLEIIVSKDLSDGAISEKNITKRLRIRLDEVDNNYKNYKSNTDVIVWKSEASEENLTKIAELESEIEMTLASADDKFADKDYVGILADANHVQYLLSEIDIVMNSEVETQDFASDNEQDVVETHSNASVQGVEEGSFSTEVETQDFASDEE